LLWRELTKLEVNNSFNYHSNQFQGGLHMHLKPTRALLSATLLLLAVWLMSCADVPSTGPTPPEMVSQFRFVHAAGDLGNVGVSVDGASVGNITYKGATTHTQFPAGSRVAVLSNSDTLRIGMESYSRGTFVLLPKAGSVRDFIKLTERRIFDPSTTGAALVRIVHAAAAPDLFVKISGDGGTIRLTGVAFRSDSGYLQMPAGSYTITVAAASDTVTALATTTLNAANKRQTSIILGDAGANALELVNLADD
jgi:hypothetical protein